MYHNATPRKSKKALVIMLVLAVLGIGAGMFLVYNGSKGGPHTVSVNGQSVDSGIAGCKAIASMQQNNDKSNNNDAWTEKEYKGFRKPFEQSKYKDVKTAGTLLVDTLYQASKLKDDDFGGALAMLGALQTQWIGFQNACGAHGVKIQDLDFSSDEG